jgi:hypothetical protein
LARSPELRAKEERASSTLALLAGRYELIGVHR